jgi:uncharacterized Fe-S cluster protein YjdI/CDGSH-type Zn-finger protein
MKNKEKVKEYSNDDITVVWKPGICIHAAICVNKLPKVYNPEGSPWITVDNATADELKSQIDACPSGALTYKLTNESQNTNKISRTMEKSKVAGTTPMVVDLKSGKAHAWCACGHSKNQPWCDGSHKGSGINPVVFKPEKDTRAAMCMCKKTGNHPYCDGTHSNIS